MAGQPVDVLRAKAVPLRGRGEDDVRSTVVGVVDALETGVGDEHFGE